MSDGRGETTPRRARSRENTIKIESERGRVCGRRVSHQLLVKIMGEGICMHGIVRWCRIAREWMDTDGTAALALAEVEPA